MPLKSKTENEGTKWNKVHMLDLMVLFVNLHLAAQDRNIGQAHAEKSLKQLTMELIRDQRGEKRRQWIQTETLEACLWACNIMNEDGKFWTPYIREPSLSFNQFLQSVLYSNQSFDKEYNRIKNHKKKEVPGGTKSNA